MEQQPIEQIPTIQDSLPVPPQVDAGVFYVPGSNEKKRAIMMYSLIGIVIVMGEKKTNEFEYFHFKQAIGWWVGFLPILLVSIFLLFLPYFKVIGVVGLLAGISTLAFFVKQARDGIYKIDMNAYRAGPFPSLGNRVVSLFDLSFDEKKDTPVA